MSYSPEPKPVQGQAQALAKMLLAHKVEQTREQEDWDAENYYRRALNGEMSLDEAVQQFRAKWYGGRPVSEAADEIMKTPRIIPAMDEQKRMLNWK